MTAYPARSNNLPSPYFYVMWGDPNGPRNKWIKDDVVFDNYAEAGERRDLKKASMGSYLEFSIIKYGA